MSRRANYILRVDGGAGIVVGLLVLALHGWLSALYGFDTRLALFIAMANVVYGLYSSSLAVRASRGIPLSRRAIEALCLANLGWGAACAGIVVATHHFATIWGLTVVAVEGCFVVCLAAAEWHWVRPLTLVNNCMESM